jgi:FkbM family methyltransferase
VHVFEPNPRFNSVLKKIKKKVTKKKHIVYLYKENAAWTYDGTVDFYLDKVSDASWGSSINQKHRDVQNGKNKVTVKCMDLARLINQYNETDLIVVKMDIEGAEYDLLKDFHKKISSRYFIIMK